MISSTVLVRDEDGRRLPYLVWRLPQPLLVASTASSGGGIGVRSWIVNAQVSHDYARHDLDAHAAELATGACLDGPGVTMFTAADLTRVRRATDGGVSAEATVGLSHPSWAAAGELVTPAGELVAPAGELAARDSAAPAAGTINIVAFLPVGLTPAALLGALCTATEAKTQALLEHGIPGTGTPSDAITIACPAEGSELFCGVRSEWGSRLARAVHAAVGAGSGAPSVTGSGAP